MNNYKPRLKTEYSERVVPALARQFGYTNLMRVPKLNKIVLSQGVGEAVADKRLIESAFEGDNVDCRTESCCNEVEEGH